MQLPQSLRFISLLAGNADQFYQELCGYLGAQVTLEITADTTLPWQQRAIALAEGTVDVAAVCGAVYVTPLDQLPLLRLLAAPVMAPARYRDQPVYFSDVIVHSSAAFHSFADLQGATFAVNEPGSFSGYAVVSHALAELAKDASFFAAVYETGAHAESVRAVLEQQADAAAIDSIVLHHMLRAQPALRDHLRVIDSFGPNPAPPLVVAAHVAPTIVAQLGSALTAMHTNQAGRAVLEIGDVSRFVAVSDSDYNLLRKRIRRSARVPLQLNT